MIRSFIFILLLLLAGKMFSQKQNLSDSALLDTVQKQTFRYFWDFAHPVSGLARERSNLADYGPETTTIGGIGIRCNGDHCGC